MFLVNRKIKLEINNKNILKSQNNYIEHNTPLNKQQFKDEVLRKPKKQYVKWMKFNILQIWDATKAQFGGKCSALNIFISWQKKLRKQNEGHFSRWIHSIIIYLKLGANGLHWLRGETSQSFRIGSTGGK